MQTFGVQLTDLDFCAAHDPRSLGKRMRAEDPRRWANGNLSRGLWPITKYEDAVRVLRGPLTSGAEAFERVDAGAISSRARPAAGTHYAPKAPPPAAPRAGRTGRAARAG